MTEANNNCKISVIIPVYNTGRFLDKCINSVLDQSYKNIEVILINDGSTDNSLEICESYAANDNRVIVVSKPNGGVSSARNCGLQRATGRYIGFLDSDDYISPEMFENLIQAAEKHDADIAECGYYTCDSAYETLEKFELEYAVTDGEYNNCYNFLAHINTKDFIWNKLYKKELFNGVVFPDLSYSEDYVVNAKLFYKCKRKATINGCYYHYVLHPESAMIISKAYGLTYSL